MNAWAGIYLWGLITGNNQYKDLGIWGYTTEYSSIKNIILI
jgi:endoglucanase Acf2